MKTITTSVTLEGRDKDGKPTVFPPGTQVTLEDAEADGIIKKHGGEVVKTADPKPGPSGTVTGSAGGTVGGVSGSQFGAKPAEVKK